VKEQVLACAEDEDGLNNGFCSVQEVIEDGDRG
jgi:hypothetical protein